MINPHLISDIELEPISESDEGRLLALFKVRFGQRIPVYEVEEAAGLQYSSRCRRKTWFACVGRLTRAQLAALEDLCRAGLRYNAAIVRVFPEATNWLRPEDNDKRKLIRDYPAPMLRSQVLTAVEQQTIQNMQPALPLEIEPRVWRDPEEMV